MNYKKNVSLVDFINNKRIWIYGIGVIGKRICQIFSYFGIKIEGIIVSSIKGNIDTYMGISVSEFDTCSISTEDLIIVTATGKAKDEICSNIALQNKEYIVWTPSLLNELWKSCDYKFINRKKDKDKLCIVLSGYKEFLWENIYERLNKYTPDDVEVCLCSAGQYSEALCEIAERNNWSYLSVPVNSVSLTQNICISIFEKANWIYKMDEDMFVTQGAFENMYAIAQEIISSGKYDFGVCSPLIPVNAIGYRYILEKYEKLFEYEKLFGKAYVGGSVQREIEKNPLAAAYMWGEGEMPQLDDIAKDFREVCEYRLCTTRLSIGLILFQRELWNRMQGFVVYGNMDLGVDEEDVNAFCINDSKVIGIAMNAIVGHFGFGKQTGEMKKYYKNNRNRF